MNAPRCGKPMLNYETRLRVAVLKDPVCGRREGHQGPCRSEVAVARMNAASVVRVAQWKAQRREAAVNLATLKRAIGRAA